MLLLHLMFSSFRFYGYATTKPFNNGARSSARVLSTRKSRVLTRREETLERYECSLVSLQVYQNGGRM